MKRLFVLILVCVLSPDPLQAFDVSGLQPLAPNGVFSTFSAEGLPSGKSSFELGFERSGEPDFYRYGLRAAFGLSDNLELNLMVPYVHNFEDVDGIEDVAIGLKHRFYEEGRYGPSVAYILSASVPSGKDELSTDGRVGLGLIVSKRLGPVNGHLNAFFVKPGKGSLEEEITLAAGFEFSAAHNFEFLGELIARKGHFTKAYKQIEARFGYRLRTSDSIYTTIGVGFDLKNRSPEYRILFSVNFTTPHEKRKIRKIIEQEE